MWFFTATVIFHLHTVQKMLVWSEGSKKKDVEKGNKGRMRREMVAKGPNMARGEGQKGGSSRLGSNSEAVMDNNTSTLFISPSVTPLTARRAASALVPLLGQDRLSSVVRTQLVSRRSCGRTGRSRRGDAGARVW